MYHLLSISKAPIDLTKAINRNKSKSKKIDKHKNKNIGHNKKVIEKHPCRNCSQIK